MSTEIISLYLVHGDPNRLRLAEVSGWSGQAVAGPRSDLPELLARGEIDRPGVYLLLGEEPRPSAAAAVVAGGPASGPIAWKNKADTTLKDLEEQS